MLVLTRKIGEQIVIAENIEITVMRIHGNKVRLALNIPRHISVQRLEVWNRIEAAGRGVPDVVDVLEERDVVSPQSTPG